MARKTSNRDSTYDTSTEQKFISVTEVEERYFPGSVSRRRAGHRSIETETRKRIQDALDGIERATGTTRSGEREKR